jgi:hypothetical protein
MVLNNPRTSLRIHKSERKSEMNRSDFKPSEIFNLIHDTRTNPQPIPYREIRNIDGKQTMVGGKCCKVLDGCGETVHELFQIRPELSIIDFHVCDICMNCGTLYCIQ